MSAPSPPPPPPSDGDGGGDRRGKRPITPSDGDGGKRPKTAAPGFVGGGDGKGAKTATPGFGGGDAGDPSPGARICGVRRRPEGISAGDPRQQPCSVCGKEFGSWKALYGHMRCHPERRWRGINPPADGGGGGGRLASMESEVAASLILLSGGGGGDGGGGGGEGEKAEAGGGGGGFVCSGCKKVFPTRQALGGHRATHKNVKGCYAMAKEEGESSHQDGGGGGGGGGEQQGEGQEEEHKCHVCSIVFESGDGLGAHMRIHNSEVGVEVGPSLSTWRVWPLDLNLPAPEEDGDLSSPSSIDLNL